MADSKVKMGRMSPRKRKELDPAKLNERCGLHLQSLMDKAGLTVKELQVQLSKRGHDFSEAGIRNWMAGRAFPTPFAMEALAEVFGLTDYRMVLAPPVQERRKE